MYSSTSIDQAPHTGRKMWRCKPENPASQPCEMALNGFRQVSCPSPIGFTDNTLGGTDALPPYEAITKG